ncbi:glucan biosynthesis protein [Aurantimonas sp. Leaf443]|uniref:glucan biosynthesis protein n=1 Tax=Aurantimonas sp. Leaf443 TaxID=1736378 RepID=UPI0006F28471|nr:glucan biosynthesis protein [Aurantimonas sp. Leaf443]KQT82493.1 glucan biosynthesis protein D [Aurantimonas sp. Leaf443]
MTTIDRRQLLAGLAALGLVPHGALAAPAAASGLTFSEPRPFSFDRLVEEARALAAAPYVPETSVDPAVMDRIDFDAHWKIKYRNDRTLDVPGANAPIRMFHLGRYFQLPVTINVVEGETSRQVVYDPSLFDMPADSPARELPKDVGFAGFRVLEPDAVRDWIAFLGGAYFRTSGESGQFGMSARAVAVDVAMPRPEEFPRFTEFYLAPSQTGTLIVYAKMNGPRVAGALRMDIKKGGPIVMDIANRFFVREDIERLGIAALTSMFWYSETDKERRSDWRPEVHDSDGLALWTGTGERLWRPLNNPPSVMTSTFADMNPKGYGLLQRDRSFDHYQDDGVFYEKRASVWIEPKGSWGPGGVQLVEIPTDDEIHDNIAAYWVSQTPARKGDALAYDYVMTWRNEAPRDLTLGRVVATRLGRGGIPGQPRPKGVTKVAIDFDDGAVAELSREAEDVEAVVSTSRGTLSGIDCYSIKVGTAWRVTFDIAVEGTDPVELRAYIRQGDKTLSETFAYQFLPLQGGQAT